MEAKTFRQRLRGLVCVWLAALMLLPSLLITPAAAVDPTEASDLAELLTLATGSETDVNENVYDFDGQTITITGSIKINSDSLNSILDEVTSTLTLKNANFLCPSSEVDTLFDIQSGVKSMTLDNIHINGATADNLKHAGPAIDSNMSGSGDTSLTMSNSSLDGWTSDDSGNGGAVRISDYYGSCKNSFTMKNSSITDCHLTSNGGAVYVGKNSIFDMTNSSVTGCSAMHGGAVFVGQNSIFDMTNSTISDCSAMHGGGVYVSAVNRYNTNFAMRGNSRIESCTANNSGGGVYADLGTSGAKGVITLSGTPVISGNKADGAVSNVHLLASDQVVIDDTLEDDTLEDDILEDGARIGVTRNTGDGYVTTANTADYSNYFYADDGEHYKIQNSDDDKNIVQLVKGESDNYWVEFNMQGHGEAIERIAVAYGEAVGDIPTPTASGYTFGGWYTDAACTKGNEWTSRTPVTEPLMVYAKWTVKRGGGGSSSSYYNITASANEGGSISPSGSVSVCEGSDKTFSIKPDTGYVISDVLVDNVSVKNELTGSSYTFVNVRKAHTIKVTFIEETRDEPFTDVKENDWFYDDVKYAHENGLMNGTGGSAFSPDDTTTRGMIVTIVYRLEGSPSIEDEIWGYPFADVDAASYYATAIYWARLNEIAGGYDSEHFGPDDPITREQMAAILYRYASFKGYDVTGQADLSKFSDYEKINSYSLTAMAWANSEGLINGMGDNLLDPNGNATRAQVAAILHRFCENVAK